MKLKEIFSSLLSCALIISVIPFNTYGANIELQNTGDLQTTDLTSACEFKLKEDDTYRTRRIYRKRCDYRRLGSAALRI